MDICYPVFHFCEILGSLKLHKWIILRFNYFMENHQEQSNNSLQPHLYNVEKIHITSKWHLTVWTYSILQKNKVPEKSTR